MVSIVCMPDFLIAYSNVILKRKHATTSPYRTPLCIIKGAESFDWIMIWLSMLDIIILTNLINFCGIFSSLMATYICSLSMLSNTLLKSIKSRWMGILDSLIFPRICRNPKIWFILDFPGRNPAWQLVSAVSQTTMDPGCYSLQYRGIWS